MQLSVLSRAKQQQPLKKSNYHSSTVTDGHKSLNNYIGFYNEWGQKDIEYC